MRLLKVLLTIAAAVIAMIAGVFALMVVVATGLLAPLFRRPAVAGSPQSGPAHQRPHERDRARATRATGSTRPPQDAIDITATEVEVVETAAPPVGRTP